MASPQNNLGTLFVNIMARVASSRCPFFCSAMPFCCEILTQVL